MKTIYKTRVMIYREGHFWRIQWNYPRMKTLKETFPSEYAANRFCEVAGWYVESVVR